MREADSAAGGKEDVKLGQRLHAGILNGELKRQGAPGGSHERGQSIFPVD